MARRMASESTSGRMGLHTKEIGSTVKLMALELIDGQTIESLPVSGSTAKSVDSVSTHGLMVAAMKASSPETRDKDMVST